MRRRSVLSYRLKVQEAVNCCSSVKGCLQYLGLRPAGGNYQQFHKWYERHGIVPPKGDCSVGLRSCNRQQIQLAEILTVGSTYNRSALKKRLIREGLLDNQCYICHCLPIWNEKPLALQLDHINGIADDNRLENLRLLCPNCHSQTSTFAGKKKFTINKIVYPSCFQCGDSISQFSRGGLCRKCASRQSSVARRTVARPSLEVLASQVRSEGYSATGRRYGVSDNAIRKWLKAYQWDVGDDGTAT